VQLLALLIPQSKQIPQSDFVEYLEMKILLIIVLIKASTCCVAKCDKKNHAPTDVNVYYHSIAEQNGIALKKTLNELIKGHERYSYTPCVWEILKEADKSPTNSEHVRGIYTGRDIHSACKDRVLRNGESFNKTCTDWWDTSKANPEKIPFTRQNAWNREHIWSKLHGFPKPKQHAYTDAHHIVAADSSVNTDRSDNDFADGGESDTECKQCREGYGTWEPPADVKGDIARMMFYMDVRYEGNDGSGTPDLQLVKSDNSKRTKKSDGYGQFGHLCTLLKWHLSDSVSIQERKRNNIIYSWQGNRNPFIDKPELVKRVWGNSCSNIFNY
jgi:serine protease